MSDRITLEELTADEALLGPWYSGDPPAADARVATPKDAAAHALLTALNAPDGTKGIVKILAKTAEEKRLTRCFLDAMLEQPKLKAMVKRLTPEQITLHGGLRIVIDLNEARLTKDVIATIALDPGEAGFIAYEVLEWEPGRTTADYDRMQEERLDEMVANGEIKPDQRGRVMFVTWLPADHPKSRYNPANKGAEQASLFAHPLDVLEPGPPQEIVPAPDPEQQLEERLAKRAREVEAEERYHKAIEARRREETAEKIADHYARTRQKGV